MKTNGTRSTVLYFATALILSLAAAVPQHRSASDDQESEKKRETPMVQLYYLEIVTPAMDETCALLTTMRGATFSKPQPGLGNARTAKLKDGGRIAVRKPMHDAEKSVVRPYVTVDDIDTAFEQAVAAGAEPMVPPTPIEDAGGRFAIYNFGGIEHGIWQP